MANQYTSYWLYQKYEKRGSQEAIPVYPNVYSVDGDGTMSKVIKIENDAACGYVPTGTTQYRWVNLDPAVDYYCDECPTPQYRWIKSDDTICVEATAQYRTISGTPYCTGYDKYVDVYSQVSYDSGSTWTTTATTPTLVEADSEDCGYVPPTPPVSCTVITYTANTKLNETTHSTGMNALHTNQFSGSSAQQLTMTSHTFENGVGRIEFDNDIVTVGTNAFLGCSGITSINLPNCITTIGNYAFYQCSGLTSCTIGSGVTSIGSDAFEYCSSLTSIDIPDSVTTIGHSAFADCSSLTSVTISDSVTSIGDGVFYNCSSLTSVTIPNSVTSIGESTFLDCTSLSSATIGSGVTSIGDYTFYRCSGLISVIVNATIPPTLGKDVFYNTNANLVIYVPTSSVSAYKSATNWSSYSSRIQAIP